MYRSITLLSTIIISISLLAGCGNDTTGPDTQAMGTLKVSLTTSGPDQDADGYLITVDENTEQPADTTDTVIFEQLAEGTHTVELSGIAPSCAVEGEAQQIAEVTTGNTTTINVRVNCRAALIHVVTGSPCYKLYGYGGVLPDYCKNEAPVPPDAQFPFPFNPFNPGTTEADANHPKGINLAQPSVSYDGTSIAFRADSSIWTANADGSGLQQLTFSGKDYSPSYCPNGGLLFTSRRDGRSQLYWIGDGDKPTRIETEQPLYEVACNPAGDPTYEAAVRVGSGARASIGLVDVDAPQGQRLKILTDNDYFEGEPAWIPDGKSLVIITEQRKGTINLATISAKDGKIEKQSDFKPGYLDRYANPSVSPDGKWVVFTSIAQPKSKPGGARLQASDYNASRSNRTYNNGIIDLNLGGDTGFSYPPLVTFSPRLK